MDADFYRNLNQTQFLEAMASCTAVTYVDGVLVGDPLDISMFEKTGWVLDETPKDSLLDEMIIA